MSGARELERINPATDSVVQKVSVGNGPTGVAVSGQSVWVTNFSDDTVVRVDAATDRVAGKPVEVGNEPVAVAADAGGAWVADSGDGTVTRIPLGGQGTQKFFVGNGPSAIALGATAVWVTNRLDGTLSRIDRTNGVVTTIPVGDGPSGLTVDSATVWVGDQFAAAVDRVNAATRVVSPAIRMHSRPDAVTLVGGKLWVAASALGLGHRGGTLRFSSANVPGSLDPSTGNDSQAKQILTLTNDGLVGFAHVDGTQGGAIVADLATSVPTPSPDRKTYAFTLRRGIHYSNGVGVKPEDFRLGIERALLNAPSNIVPYYSEIVGAASCKKSMCDLRKGIVTNDTARTVTFHLTRPDPDFLDQLGLNFADAVPAGTPSKPVTTTPLPATGPYMIASYKHTRLTGRDPKGTIELVRNPHFVEWSQAAQPAGYPNRIEGTYGADPAQEVSGVEHGQLDVAYDPPPTELSQLFTRYPNQLHSTEQPFFALGFALNMHLAPFNDVGVRKALNLAINRKKMVTLEGGSRLSQVTCQVVPAGFPGYHPYCPYTLHRNPSGTWSAPELHRAKNLVKASGTSGERIDVWTAAPARSEAHYLVGVLKALQYKPHLHVKSFSTWTSEIYNPSTSAAMQMSFFPWGPDYPSPSNIEAPLFACASIASGLNQAHFCNSKVSAEMKTARSSEARDPAAANQAWARVDRTLVNLAPWVPLPTPLQVYFVSTRTGDFQVNPQYGVLLSQLWVR